MRATYAFDYDRLCANLAAQLEAAHVDPPAALFFWPGGIREIEMRRQPGIAPTIQQILYAKDLCRRLNAEMHLGGMWIVVFSDPEPETGVPHRLVALFKDADGDINFSLDSEDHYRRMLAEPVENWGQDAAKAVMGHAELLKKMDIGQREQIKRALGQPSADPYAQFPLT